MQASSLKFLAIAAAAVVPMLATGVAGAEEYEGVHAASSVRSRDDVNLEAQKAASAPDQNVARGSRGAERFTPAADPQAVRADAVRAASAPDQNVASGSRVNSKVISTLQNPADARAASQPKAKSL